ncbi:MAG: FtsX-like permease family protein [Dehalococcoidia bacterium]
MTLLTRQNLLSEKVGFLISVAGIALSVFLIAFLLSLYRGWDEGVGRFVERVDADVWVAREGTSDFLNAASILPTDMGRDLGRVDGVSEAFPVIVRPMNVTADGKEIGAQLVGYDPESGVGGPHKHESGAETPGQDEVIIDTAFGKQNGVGIGDSIEAAGRSLEIVGESSGGDFVFTQTMFVSLETARDMLGMDDWNTFYLLQLDGGAGADAVIASIEQDFEATGAFESDEFAEATRNRIMKSVIPILIVVLALAFVVGVAITGLTIYNSTVEKAREYGILKAIGFTNRYLFRLVMEQSVVTCMLGFVLGAGGTILATRFVSDFVPQFVTLLRWQDLLMVLGTTLIMSVIAAVLPVRRIANVDPVSVFSG